MKAMDPLKEETGGGEYTKKTKQILRNPSRTNTLTEKKKEKKKVQKKYVL